MTSSKELHPITVIVFGLLFGWAILARPPDFTGWTLRMLAVGLASIAFWGALAILVLSFV